MVTFSVVGCSSSNTDSASSENNSANKGDVVVATSVAITQILDRLDVAVSGVQKLIMTFQKAQKVQQKLEVQ